MVPLLPRLLLGPLQVPLPFPPHPLVSLCRKSCSGQTGCEQTQAWPTQSSPPSAPPHPVQPSTEIFESFYMLLLMQLGGRLSYFGPLGFESRHLIAYLERQPGVHGIRPGSNPATWWGASARLRAERLSVHCA